MNTRWPRRFFYLRAHTERKCACQNKFDSRQTQWSSFGLTLPKGRRLRDGPANTATLLLCQLTGAPKSSGSTERHHLFNLNPSANQRSLYWYLRLRCPCFYNPIGSLWTSIFHCNGNQGKFYSLTCFSRGDRYTRRLTGTQSISGSHLEQVSRSWQQILHHELQISGADIDSYFLPRRAIPQSEVQNLGVSVKRSPPLQFNYRACRRSHFHRQILGSLWEIIRARMVREFP